MADDEEVIIVEEGEDELPSSPEEDEKAAASQARGKKRKLLIIAGAIIVVLLSAILAFILLGRSTPQQTAEASPSKLAEKIQQASTVQEVQTHLDTMIKKANLLYQKGNKKDALALFEQVASYSASVSNYNLGVAQMRQQQYETAIEAFNLAIDNGENRCISALNAAVCALHLGAHKRFSYYLQLAKIYLGDAFNSPLYGYLHALINFYEGNYVETLIPYLHNSGVYQERLSSVAAVSYAQLHQPLKAIGALEASGNVDEMTLGLMYARIGDYALAASHIKNALDSGIRPRRTSLALALVLLKAGNPAEGGQFLEKYIGTSDQNTTSPYPVEVTLKPSVTDITSAQKALSFSGLLQKPQAYQLLFEFAPYKVFNANEPLSIIQKGNAAMITNRMGEAERYLGQSAQRSSINQVITQAIMLALNHRLKKANRLLLEAEKSNPNHSILHYNLGVTFAKLGHYRQAHHHFLRSYHLDASNHLAAIYTLMCEPFVNIRTPQVLKFLQEEFSTQSTPDASDKYHRALFYYLQNNFSALMNWSEENKDARPDKLLLSLLVSHHLGLQQRSTQLATQIRRQMPKNIVANLLYLAATGNPERVKTFSARTLDYFKSHPLDFESLYYGSRFARQKYIALRYITGTLYSLTELLENRLLEEEDEADGTLEALILGNLYLNRFEEAYTLANTLIDTYKNDDTYTLLLGAVASVGAKHNANATALLELAKLVNPDNLESRYGLGLFYLEESNFKAAAVQFSNMTGGKFDSQYFDFRIVNAAVRSKR